MFLVERFSKKTLNFLVDFIPRITPIYLWRATAPQDYKAGKELGKKLKAKQRLKNSYRLDNTEFQSIKCGICVSKLRS